MNDTIKNKHANDSAYLQALISKGGEVIIPKQNPLTDDNVWLIEHRLVVGSDTTVILDGAYMIMADGVYEMFFSTEAVLGADDSPKKNIKIIGKNGATLDGGNFNGLTERNSGKDGLPHIRNNTPIQLRNTVGFEVSGLKIVEQRYWGMTFVNCSEGVIRNIEFDANNTAPNQDGIDLRIGCHHILVENITGVTGDDVIAMTALSGGLDSTLIEDGVCGDIHDITVRNVNAACAGGHGLIRLLCHDGNKIYNITVENIIDNSVYTGPLPHATVRVGDPNYWTIKRATAEDMYNITIRGVRSSAPGAITVWHDHENFTYEDVENTRGVILAPMHRS